MGVLEQVATSVRYSCRGSQAMVMASWLGYTLMCEIERRLGPAHLDGVVGDVIGDHLIDIVWGSWLLLWYWWADGDARRPAGLEEPPVIAWPADPVASEGAPQMSGVREKESPFENWVD